MAGIIRGRRDALAKLELNFKVMGTGNFEPHPDIESKWADLHVHMWMSDEERQSYIREIRERKAARIIQRAAERGDGQAEAVLEAQKAQEQAALAEARENEKATVDVCLRGLRKRLYAHDEKGEGWVECAPARNACRSEGLSVAVDGDARDRCRLQDVVKTAERAAHRREQPRDVECTRVPPETPLPSIADLRRAFYAADGAGHGAVAAESVQRRWRERCGAAADPAVLAAASNKHNKITLAALEEAIAARGRRPAASAASRSVTAALLNSARRKPPQGGSSEASSAPKAPDIIIEEVPPPRRRREIIVIRDEEREAEATRIRLLGDDAPAEPPAMPEAPPFREMRGGLRPGPARYFSTGVVAGATSAFVDLTAEDDAATFDLRMGVAFDDVDPADASLSCTLRYRGAAHEVRAPVLGTEGGPCRAPVVRVARSSSPLRIAVFGGDGAPLATAALDLSVLTSGARAVLRAAPAWRGARVLGLVFEAEAIRSTQ